MRKKTRTRFAAIMMGLTLAVSGITAMPVAAAQNTAASENFSLLDVTTTMIDAGLYTTDAQQEQVISLFTGPDGNSYVSVIQVSADGQGDVICGSYGASDVKSKKDADGTDWTTISFIDAYTGTRCSVVFAEFDDGSVLVANSDFSLITEAQYLTAAETITYMGAAVNFLN